MVGPTEQCGRLHDVLAQNPASNGLRDGSDLELCGGVGLFNTMVSKKINVAYRGNVCHLSYVFQLPNSIQLLILKKTFS